jgi:hypothetical protein
MRRAEISAQCYSALQVSDICHLLERVSEESELARVRRDVHAEQVLDYAGCSYGVQEIAGVMNPRQSGTPTPFARSCTSTI